MCHRGIISRVTAFTLPGNIPVYAFSIFLGLGAATGLAWSVSRIKPNQVRILLDTGLVSLVGGLLGGRIGYVVVQWPYFRDHLDEVFQFQLGGISWLGAALGSVLVLVGYATVRRSPVAELLDALLPLATSMAVSAWLACWLEGAAYGVSAQMLPARDAWGEIAPRVPVQFLGAILTLGLFALVDWRQPLRSVPGQMAITWGLGFSMLMFVLTLLRGDIAPTWLGMRLDAWAAAILIGACLLGWRYHHQFAGRKVEELG